jgi:hypothetical protein
VLDDEASVPGSSGAVLKSLVATSKTEGVAFALPFVVGSSVVVRRTG